MIKLFLSFLVLLLTVAGFATPASPISAGETNGSGSPVLNAGPSLDGHNPSEILISDVGGYLQTLNLQTLTVTELHNFNTTGNFDIRYSNPWEIVIANYDKHRIERFDLRTKLLEIIVEGPPLSRPIGVAPSPRSFYYIADHDGAIFSYDIRAGKLELLANKGPDEEPFDQPDGIVEDPRGRVIFTDHAGRIYRIEPKDKSITEIASFPGAILNGVVLLPGGDLVVASSDNPPAIFRVNPDTGEFTTLHQGTPFRNPEDVAVDPQGENIYVLDTDYQAVFPPGPQPEIYIFNLHTGMLQSLSVGDQLYKSVVDIILRPYTGTR